jgi:hypothetical protein
MRHFSARRIPAGTHTRQFWQLTKEEQAERVKKLISSGLRAQAVSDLTGLKVEHIAAILAGAT